MILTLNKLTLNTDKFEAISIDKSETSVKVMVHTPTKVYEVYEIPACTLDEVPFSRCDEIIKYFYSCVLKEAGKYTQYKNYGVREDKLDDVIYEYHSKLLSDKLFIDAINNIADIEKTEGNREKLREYTKVAKEQEEKYRKSALISVDSLIKYDL